MSVMNKLAHALGRRDDVPNQELARELANSGDQTAIEELVAGLDNPDKNIQSDCIKVLYELGYLAPERIATYWERFFDLLHSKNNRLVWGGMIALATIAPLKARQLYIRREGLIQAIETGSVITIDAGIQALARIAVQDPAYRSELFPYLLDHLRHCRPKDVAQRAEQIAVAVGVEHKAEFLAVLAARMELLKASQIKRLEKLIRSLE